MPTCQPDPGLDPRKLAGLLAARHNPHTLIETITAHLQAHQGYLAFSGGKDSLVALHLARQADPQLPVCFFDSGLEYPETLHFIDDLTEQWHLNLEVIPAEHSTLEVLVGNGTWSWHRTSHSTASLMRNNILEPAGRAHRYYGNGEIWGLRACESAGRRAALFHPSNPASGVIARLDGTIAYSPVWNFTTREIWGYLSRHRVPTNPLYDKLRRLGAPEHAQRVCHMVDAGQLHRGSLVWLKRGWPDLYEILTDVLPRAAEHA